MKFLLIDDNPFDRELLKRGLTALFAGAVYVEVIDNQSFEHALQTLDYELVFTDYQLKWITGLEILKRIRHLSADLPVIMVTDTGSEEIATEAMKNGLNDYLLKTHLARLPIAVEECFKKSWLQRERRELEAQLQKAQKMESLGLLVSGIAHDFNNLLAAIIGYAQRGMHSISPPHPLYEQFAAIQNRAEQGARMTHQLLSFARGTPLNPSRLSLQKMLEELREFIQKLLGPSIELHLEIDAALHLVYADRTQIEQVLVNLCLNARDAMPGGGRLTIAGQNVLLDQTSQERVEVLAGLYVLLTVSDTGVGMDLQTQDRLFEPFFTTKDIGQGTGLGLAVVYGIIKQHNGFIQVRSAPGEGTTFALYFPATIEVVREQEEETVLEQEPLPGGSETLLVLEDDQDIQWIMSEFLHECGYTVIVASDGEEGLSLFQKHASSIALVIADIMMPKMKGKEFQTYIHRSHPEVKILIVSGYQEIDLKRRELLDAQSAFLQKPFSLDTLASKVRELIES
jgi:signal transduction histidine kinase